MPWTKLGSASGSGDLEVSFDSGYNYLYVDCYIEDGNGLFFKFNDSTSSTDIDLRYEIENTTGTQQNRAGIWCYYDGNDVYKKCTMHVTNQDGYDSMCILEASTSTTTTASSQAPKKCYTLGYWKNTNQITKITGYAFSGTTSANSTMVVYGSE